MQESLHFFLLNISSREASPNPHSLCSQHFPSIPSKPLFHPCFSIYNWWLQLSNHESQIQATVSNRPQIRERTEFRARTATKTMLTFPEQTHEPGYVTPHMSARVCVRGVNRWKSIHHRSAKWQGELLWYWKLKLQYDALDTKETFDYSFRTK